MSQGCIFSFRYHGSFGHVSSRKVYHIVAAGSQVGSKAVQAVKTLHCLDALVFQSYLRPGGVLDLFFGVQSYRHTSQRCLETYPVGMFFFKGLQIEKNGQSYETQLPKKEGIILVVSKSPMNFRGSHLRVAPGHLTSWESKDGPTPQTAPKEVRQGLQKRGLYIFPSCARFCPTEKSRPSTRYQPGLKGFKGTKTFMDWVGFLRLKL